MFKKGNFLFILAIGLILTALVGVWFLSKQKTESRDAEVVLTSHIKGNTESEVKLVEYSDFECPACANFYMVLKPLLEKLGDKISFEYKHFPLTSIHNKAIIAAMAAEAAGQQGKFFEFHDWLFEERNAWAAGSIDNAEAVFIKQAETMGLDVDLFKTHLKSKVLREDKVLADRDEALKLKINSTPTFFLNGEKMEFKTFDEFLSQIAEALGISMSDLLGEEVSKNEKDKNNIEN